MRHRATGFFDFGNSVARLKSFGISASLATSLSSLVGELRRGSVGELRRVGELGQGANVVLKTFRKGFLGSVPCGVGKMVRKP